LGIATGVFAYALYENSPRADRPEERRLWAHVKRYWNVGQGWNRQTTATTATTTTIPDDQAELEELAKVLASEEGKTS
jgi:hypothetical protein